MTQRKSPRLTICLDGDFALRGVAANHRKPCLDPLLKESNEDIMSGLPDYILSHILSFLPTKDAVKTSILAKSWRYTWTSVPNLDFDTIWLYDLCDKSESNREYRLKLFKKYAKGILLHRVDPIKRLCLRFGSLSSNFANKLICSAIMHHVEELQLAMGGMRTLYQLPEILFNCGTLKILKLSGDVLSERCGSVCLPCLKILYLYGISSLYADVIRKIIFGSPVLEELSIYTPMYFYNRTLCLQSSSLKSLVIENYSCITDEDNYHRLVLDTPNLEFLQLTDCIAREFNFDNLYYLVKASIDVSQRFSHMKVGQYGDQVFQILRQMPNVKDIYLSQYTLQALSKASHCNFPCFTNLTHLEVGAPEDGWFPLLLSQILRCSPNLKVLLLRGGFIDDTRRIKDDVEDRTNGRVSWEDVFGEQSVPQCLVSSVERIKLFLMDANEETLKLMEQFLITATVLKEFAFIDYLACREEELDFLYKLVKFPRASSTCRILISRRIPLLG